MDIYTAIQTRRTVRDFDDKPIEMDIIEKNNWRGIKSADKRPHEKLGICYR